jgi:ABC-2 type transport system permease protein
MIPAIRSEFRKLLTVRSTYINVIISLAIVALFAGFGSGFRMDSASAHDTGYLMMQSMSAIVFVGMILAFIGLLLAGHEYRYNTIMYTLTATNRRYKVLVSKFVAITVFTIVVSLLVAFFSPLCTIIGAHLAGKTLAPQQFDTWSVIWRSIFTGWGYAMYAFVLLLIIRNQIGAIVTYLLVPLIGENILMQLFKNIGKNLPFTSLQAVSQPTALGNHTTSAHSVGVVLVYVAIGLLVSTVLFVKRDAN